MIDNQIKSNCADRFLTDKYIKNCKTKIFILFISFILLIFYGCSGTKLDKVDVNSIKQKTKDIKKEDLDKLKKKLKDLK